MGSYKRVLLKLSGGAIGKGSDIFHQPALVHVANEVKSAVESGVQLAIVVGGGNIFRGRLAEDWDIDRAEADNVGMLATIMNALIVKQVLDKKGLECHVMTPFKVASITELFKRERAKQYMDSGEIVIFGGGIGQPFMSTDYPSVQRALEINSSVVLMAKEGTKGVFDSDPNVFKNARMFKTLNFQDALERKLMVADQSAFLLARDQNIPMIVFDFFVENAIKRICEGEEIGTYVGNDCDTTYYDIK